MKKKIQLAKHDNPDIPGYETTTLLINGTTDKYGYFKKGIILAQFFNETIGQAEEFAEYVLELIKKDKGI